MELFAFTDANLRKFPTNSKKYLMQTVKDGEGELRVYIAVVNHRQESR